MILQNASVSIGSSPFSLMKNKRKRRNITERVSSLIERRSVETAPTLLRIRALFRTHFLLSYPSHLLPRLLDEYGSRHQVP
jgi:hypothetical protein